MYEKKKDLSSQAAQNCLTGRGLESPGVHFASFGYKPPYHLKTQHMSTLDISCKKRSSLDSKHGLSEGNTEDLSL